MTSALRHRPIFGGPFGMGRYALASIPWVHRGLHATRFLVIEPAAGTVVSIADGKLEALAAAREVLSATEHLARAEALERGQIVNQLTLWPPEAFAQPPVRERTRPVSRRRRDIYAKCGGACFYCHAPLRLAGPWHVEHQLPRALGGLDEIGNLVAACAPCNLAKGDKTAIEFVSQKQGDL